MSRTIEDLFFDAAVMLEDLHSIAVEGQQADNVHAMQTVLMSHLHDGLTALGGIMRHMTDAVESRLP